MKNKYAFFTLLNTRKLDFLEGLKSLFLVPEIVILGSWNVRTKKIASIKKFFESLRSPAMENEKYVKMFYCYKKRRKIVEGILSFQFDNKSNYILILVLIWTKSCKKMKRKNTESVL